MWCKGDGPLPAAVFRGLIAPASLKHTNLRMITSIYYCFPGLDCPGLIEAIWGSGRGRQSISTVFRGLIAPASLKRAMSRRALAESCVCFPGLDCPGLIEAMPRITRFSCRLPFSGA